MTPSAAPLRTPEERSRELVFVAFVAIAAAITTIVFGVKGPVDRIETREADRLLEAGAILLDVRDPLRFQLQHDPRAINIPAADVASRNREIPRDRRVIVVCDDDADCQHAVFVLRAVGVDAREVRHGERGW